jgi:hypothetical protein
MNECTDFSQFHQVSPLLVNPFLTEVFSIFKSRLLGAGLVERPDPGKQISKPKKKLDSYRIVLYIRIMAKRKYMIYVDQDVYESLRKVVEARGMALSPYIETLLRENLIALKELKDVKTVGDISVSQLFKLFTQSITDLQNVAKKSKKSKK